MELFRKSGWVIASLVMIFPLVLIITECTKEAKKERRLKNELCLLLAISTQAVLPSASEKSCNLRPEEYIF